MSKRVPAEWEPQEAIWLQWPGPYEKAHETAFAKMTSVIVAYEKLHILHYSKRVRDEARDAIKRVGGDPDHENIVWHTIANDSVGSNDYIGTNSHFGTNRCRTRNYNRFMDSFQRNIYGGFE